MSSSPISATTALAALPTASGRAPNKIQDAAKQFEALLLHQILSSARGSGKGWLATGDEDASADCATDFAEQQFAAVLAQNGGLGLANLITASLKDKS
jgi:Rod binding domain-containing protein